MHMSVYRFTTGWNSGLPHFNIGDAIISLCGFKNWYLSIFIGKSRVVGDICRYSVTLDSAICSDF